MLQRRRGWRATTSTQEQDSVIDDGGGWKPRQKRRIDYVPARTLLSMPREKETLENRSLTCRSKIVNGRYAAHPYRVRPRKLSIARLARAGFGCSLRSIWMFSSTSIGLYDQQQLFRSHARTSVATSGVLPRPPKLSRLSFQALLLR